MSRPVLISPAPKAIGFSAFASMFLIMLVATLAAVDARATPKLPTCAIASLVACFISFSRLSVLNFSSFVAFLAASTASSNPSAIVDADLAASSVAFLSFFSSATLPLSVLLTAARMACIVSSCAAPSTVTSPKPGMSILIAMGFIQINIWYYIVYLWSLKPL